MSSVPIFSLHFLFSIILQRANPNPVFFPRQIKVHCAEPFTEYWTCIDYSGLQLFRRCRRQQAKFDECVLDKLGWVRPDLGELSKVRRFLPVIDSLRVSKDRRWLGKGPLGVQIRCEKSKFPKQVN